MLLIPGKKKRKYQLFPQDPANLSDDCGMASSQKILIGKNNLSLRREKEVYPANIGLKLLNDKGRKSK